MYNLESLYLDSRGVASRRLRLNMTVTVHIPSMLRAECGGAAQFSLAASSVREVLAQLEQSHPGLYRSVCNETGAVRRHVHLFLNDELLPGRDGFDRPLQPGDVLSIMPAVSGG